MTWTDASGILAQGGTVIGTARCPEFREYEGRHAAALHLIEQGIDRLVVIGVAVLTVGLGAPPWGITAGLALVALGSLSTVVQRVLVVRRQLVDGAPAPARAGGRRGAAVNA